MELVLDGIQEYFVHMCRKWAYKKVNCQICTAADVNELLRLIRYTISLHACASWYKLPSDVNSRDGMVFFKGKPRGIQPLTSKRCRKIKTSIFFTPYLFRQKKQGKMAKR